MKMLKVCLVLLLSVLTFDVANAASFRNFNRRDREMRRHERWERRHHREDRFRHDRGRDHGYHDYRDRY